jgi:hypothetical protein
MSNIKLEELRNNIFSDKFIATVITYIVIIPLIIGYSILVITASRVLKVKGSKLLITSKWKMYNKILNLDDIVSWGFLSGTNNGSMISIKTTKEKTKLSNYEFTNLYLLEDYLRENYKEYEI